MRSQKYGLTWINSVGTEWVIMEHSANSKNRRGADWELGAQPVVESSYLKCTRER